MNIAVLGAGNTGLALAAHAAEQDHQVTLWNRFEDEISHLLETHTIYSKGEISGDFKIALVTTDMKAALKNAELILISTPAFVHRYFAEEIAKHISREAIILLCPGRTYGALEFQAIYDQHNQEYTQTVAETQTSVYTCRKISDDSVDIISIKYNVLFSAVKHDENERIYKLLPEHLKAQLMPAKSIIETSIGNVGLIMHCTPLLLNTGWTENKNSNYKYYIEGISPSIAKLLEKIDAERIHVSKKMGVEVESVKEWLKRVYKVEGDTLYESIQNTTAYATIDAPTSLEHRYITEDVPNGLVPLESTGKHLGLAMKHTGIIIDLASVLLEKDFRKDGRNLDTIFQGDTCKIDAFLNRGEMSD